LKIGQIIVQYVKPVLTRLLCKRKQNLKKYPKIILPYLKYEVTGQGNGKLLGLLNILLELLLTQPYTTHDLDHQLAETTFLAHLVFKSLAKSLHHAVILSVTLLQVPLRHGIKNEQIYF
jgi:hypothetical protein